MNNKIELKSINDLLELNFYIPSYQRGYRWNKQQVKDLLEDIQEFIDKKKEEFIDKKKEEFYCIQPLVVRRSIPDPKINDFKTGLDQIRNTVSEKKLVEETEKLIFNTIQWEIIDGQQRLTTIYILLRILGDEKKYSIEYQTRQDSKSFLENIDKTKKEENIDYFHIAEAKNEIESWFKNYDDQKKSKFLQTLLYDVKFIWYESVDEDPIKVFTRLNIGKISLTNAELIKALFLNKSNFGGSYQRVRLQQNEIALEWDQIEYTLQSDEFWLFLHKANYDKPTRIDFIFDIICEKNILKLTDEERKNLGSDDYRTFRYFYKWFKLQENLNIADCWKEVKIIFQTIQEWYNDIKLYHYIGFLIEQGTTISFILDKWNHLTSIDQFISEYLYAEIKIKIEKCSDLDRLYEDNARAQCRPILLLHNIQTVINQNQKLIEKDKYKLPVFYKFPFHLFKREDWDVEHIDSHTENGLDNEKVQKEWLKSCLVAGVSKEIEDEIRSFINSKVNENQNNFDSLRLAIVSTENKNKIEESEKDKVWNFTLLDSSTNRSYGNAIFPAKRRVILGKDQGKKITVDEYFEIMESESASAFIPPCTKNIFLKYYNPLTNNLREWDKTDAEAYLKNIKDTLQRFLN
jgi:transcriptional regulator of NAD metabolism